MATRLRKVRKLRGSRTMGWGPVGQHRKSGSRGGRGKAGLAKHKWTWTVKYSPDYFGKYGIRNRRLTPSHSWINVGRLDDLARSSSSGRVAGKIRTLDLTALGYGVLLGGGSVKGSYRVISRSATEFAKKKVEASGGKVVIR